MRAKQTGDQFRCWIAGCATGEEAYSVAIVLSEVMRRTGRRPRVQIFATDLDERALAAARKAHYSRASLVDLPEELTQRYFVPVDDRMQVVSELRDMVVFAKHDLANDPPFLSLDLVTCRNVLIYFGSKLQQRVLGTFHYSLGPEGVLFLGRSESAAQPPGCFEAVDKLSKIYYRTGKPREIPQPRSHREHQREVELAARDRERSRGLEVFYSLIAAVVPDSVLIDEDRNIRQLFGNAGAYLRLPTGDATTAINKLVPAPVALELGTLLHRAGSTGRAIRGQRHAVELPGKGEVHLLLHIVPIGQGTHQEFLVGFEEYAADSLPLPRDTEAVVAGAESAEEKITRLEAELRAARSHLQHTAEEHETVNEELQALNEEMQSTNEELQSANEELETTNEELQSANEELTTVNQELNVKSAELQSLNQRLSAIQNAIFYPLLIVDRELRLQNYNPASRYLFRTAEADVGSGLKTIPAYVDIGEVAVALDDAFQNHTDRSLELSAQDRHFEVRIQLFRDGRQKVSGAVVSFVEITQLRKALEAAELKQRQMLAITENTPALITMKDSQGVYTYANSRFCQVTGLSASEVVGRTDEQIFGPEPGSRMRERDFEVLKLRHAMQTEDHVVLADTHAWWLTSRFPLLDGDNKAYSICTVSLDATERVQYQDELELFRKIISDATDGIAIFEQLSAEDDFRLMYCTGLVLAEHGLETRWSQGSDLASLITRLFGSTGSETVDSITQSMLSEKAASATYSIGGEGADERWLELRSYRVAPKEGRPGHLVMIINDVTQQVNSEKTVREQKEALARFSRFAALGEVAAGISHEISTPLNAITTKTELLRRMVSTGNIDSARMEKGTRDIDRMVENIDQVITGLKSISRMASHDERRYASLTRLIDDTMRVIAFSSRGRRISIERVLPEKEIEVWCNPVQVSQILVNLINNAIDAIGQQEAPWIRIRVSEENERVVVEVIDSGDGVPQEIAERIMTPFFTTKGRDKGTGLGLSLSRSIARRHGGDLELCRDATHTTFRLSLPTRAAAPPGEEIA